MSGWCLAGCRQHSYRDALSKRPSRGSLRISRQIVRRYSMFGKFSVRKMPIAKHCPYCHKPILRLGGLGFQMQTRQRHQPLPTIKAHQQKTHLHPTTTVVFLILSYLIPSLSLNRLSKVDILASHPLRKRAQDVSNINNPTSLARNGSDCEPV